MQKTSRKKQLKIINLYKNGFTSTQIAKQISLHSSTVLNILERNGVDRRVGAVNKVIRKLDNNAIIYAYEEQKMDIQNIAKNEHTNPERITRLLKESGIKIRRGRTHRSPNYTLNDKYFNVIDSPIKAYLLGLLYADGCVFQKSNTINLISNDLELIHLFKHEIECNKDIYRNPNHKNAQTFNITSSEMKEDLIKLGCVPQKSLILKFPTNDQLPEKYIPAFLLGNFDGDGSILFLKTKNNDPQSYFSGTLQFCEKIKQYLEKNNIKTNKIQPNATIFRTRITGKENNKNLYNLLYKIFPELNGLSRKRKRFESI